MLMCVINLSAAAIIFISLKYAFRFNYRYTYLFSGTYFQLFSHDIEQSQVDILI